jgi:hypothetical protein
LLPGCERVIRVRFWFGRILGFGILVEGLSIQVLGKGASVAIGVVLKAVFFQFGVPGAIAGNFTVSQK